MPKVDQKYVKEKKEHILRSARECFSKNGFHKTTMRDIQRQSSLSAGAVYSYFRGKEEIIEAIATQDLENRMNIIMKTSMNGVSAGLERMAMDFFQPLTGAEKPLISLELELWAEAKRNRRILEIQRKSLHTIRKRFEEFILRAQKDGELSPDLDPVSLATILISFRRGLMAQLVVDKNLDVKAYTQAVVKLIRPHFIKTWAGEKS